MFKIWYFQQHFLKLFCELFRSYEFLESKSLNKFLNHAFVCFIWIHFDKENARQSWISYKFLIEHLKFKICPFLFLKACVACWLNVHNSFMKLLVQTWTSLYYNTHVHTQACMSACMCMYTCMYILKIQMTSSYDNGQHMATIIGCVTWSYFTKTKKCLIFLSIPTSSYSLGDWPHLFQFICPSSQKI